MYEDEHRAYYRRLVYIFLVLIMFLLAGTVSYHYMEGWNYVDSLYFSAATMTTVGYGDFVPKTIEGKLFAVVYMFSGVGMALYGLSVLASYFVGLKEKSWMEGIEKLHIKQRTGSFIGKIKKAFTYNADLIREGNKNIREIYRKKK